MAGNTTMALHCQHPATTILASPPRWVLSATCIGAAPRSYHHSLTTYGCIKEKVYGNGHADMANTVSPPWGCHRTNNTIAVGLTVGSTAGHWHHGIASYNRMLRIMQTLEWHRLPSGTNRQSGPGSTTRAWPLCNTTRVSPPWWNPHWQPWRNIHIHV